jgi:hypothetical protein
MTLPDDYCRCHDDKCPERGDCMRWLERGRGSYPNAKLVHASSLRLFLDQNGKCQSRIPVESSAC